MLKLVIPFSCLNNLMLRYDQIKSILLTLWNWKHLFEAFTALKRFIIVIKFCFMCEDRVFFRPQVRSTSFVAWYIFFSGYISIEPNIFANTQINKCVNIFGYHISLKKRDLRDLSLNWFQSLFVVLVRSFTENVPFHFPSSFFIVIYF